MTGDPAAPTLATYYAMGVRNFDVRGALDSLVRQATVQNPDALSDARCPGQCVGQRPTLDTYLALRYAANDICHCWGGAAETLERSLADFSLAMWARQAGRGDLSRRLRPRGDYWKNTFNPAVGYQAARRADGSWQPGSSPSTDIGFAQGTSATYTWMVPQNVSGLATLMGGREAAATRLDGLCHDENGNWPVLGGNLLRYDPTNEPGIHAPWLYNGLGQPWKTQETVRRIVDTAYGVGPGRPLRAIPRAAARGRRRRGSRGGCAGAREPEVGRSGVTAWEAVAAYPAGCHSRTATSWISRWPSRRPQNAAR